MIDPAAAVAIAQSLVDRSLKAGATAADATYAGGLSSSVEVRLGALEKVSRDEGESISLRLFDGQRSASVATSDFSEETLASLVDRCLAMAREAPEDPYAGLAPSELLERDPPDLELGDFVEPEPRELRERALSAEAAALAVPGVTNSSGAGASANSHVVALATSHGFAGAYRSGGHGISAAVIAGEGSAMQRDHDWHGARYLGDLDDPEILGRRAGKRAVKRLGQGRIKPGAYPVLFDPRVSSSLLNHFSSAINGGSVARGTSFLKDRLSDQVFAKGVRVFDDPLRHRGLRSHPFDGEGLRVAPAALVDDGRLTQWIADSAAARQLGIEPTGHAGRGGGASPSNLILEPGRRSREELLNAFPEMLLVIELIGQGVNGVTGDYSRGAAGFIVRGGEICEAVSEITIASNLKHMFATLEPGSDLEIRRGVDAPTVLIPEMAVGSA